MLTNKFDICYIRPLRINVLKSRIRVSCINYKMCGVKNELSKDSRREYPMEI